MKPLESPSLSGAPAPQENETCSTRSAAKLLGVSLRTVQLWVDNGLLEAWKTFGGHRRIAVTSVQRLLQKRTLALSPPPATQEKVLADTEPPHLTMLVVEDDPDLLRLYEAQISSWSTPSLRLLTASNGFEGLLKMGESQPDLLVTDLAMPGMDGLQMLRTLDSQGALRRMRIAVVTGLDKEDIALRGGLPEQVVLLRKPVPFERLQAMALELATDSVS